MVDPTSRTGVSARAAGTLLAAGEHEHPGLLHHLQGCCDPASVRVSPPVRADLEVPSSTGAGDLASKRSTCSGCLPAALTALMKRAAA
jgi:hypothetical protein